MTVAKMRAQVKVQPVAITQEKEKFNYVVGRPPTGIWLARGDNALIVHTDGTKEVRYGTMKDAEKVIVEANKKTGEKNFIYPLIQSFN